jgi:hypothetical protein
MPTKTLDVASTSVRDVERALRALGARITEQHTTLGAVGYTTITITTKG